MWRGSPLAQLLEDAEGGHMTLTWARLATFPVVDRLGGSVDEQAALH